MFLLLLPPLALAISRGVTSYLCPRAVTLATVMVRGGHLAWLQAGRTQLHEAMVCANIGVEGGWQWRGESDQRRRKEREMHPFSHVFDMGVFPTGVKKEGLTGLSELSPGHTHKHVFVTLEDIAFMPIQNYQIKLNITFDQSIYNPLLKPTSTK